MASEKKPSIYYDRGTIGSSAELDEYGVWVKSEPQDLSSAGTDSQEFSDPSIPDMDLPDFDGGSGDFSDDTVDFDIPGEDAIDGGFDDLGLPEEADPLSFSDDTLNETGQEDEISGEEAEFTEVSMEDFLSSPSEDLDESILVEEDSGSPAEKTSGEDLSTRLLMKIADELSSIRTELTTLKKEFSHIRGEAAPAEHAETQVRGGFFDEEDDEKIALTGDELDNILNTADFTEESGEDATETLKDDFASLESDEPLISGSPDEIDTPLPDMLSDQEDIIQESPAEAAGAEAADAETADFSLPDESAPENGEAGMDLDLGQFDLDELGGETKVEDEVSLNDDFSSEFEEFSGFDDNAVEVDDSKSAAEISPDEDSEELRRLREQGAVPMTPPPEDTSYLEEEALAEEDLTLDMEETSGSLSLDSVSLDEETESLPAEENFDDISIDLSAAVIDEPDLGSGITDNPPQEPELDEISLGGDDLSLDLDTEDTEITGEDKAGDLSFDDFSDESSLSSDLPPLEETPELPSVQSEEDTITQVIPEGFIVDAEDSPVPFEDDFEEDTVTAEGELAPLDDEPAGPPLEIPEDEDMIPAADDIPSDIKQELKAVLSYMDQLLESLPDDKIEEFAKSEYFDTYKKLFKELGLV
jgi:hypothetical protein